MVFIIADMTLPQKAPSSLIKTAIIRFTFISLVIHKLKMFLYIPILRIHSVILVHHSPKMKDSYSYIFPKGLMERRLFTKICQNTARMSLLRLYSKDLKMNTV